MTWNPTIDLGQLLTVIVIIVSVVGAHYTIKARLDNLEKKLDETVRTFGTRLDRHDEVISTVAGHVQRLIGRVESGPIITRRDDHL